MFPTLSIGPLSIPVPEFSLILGVWLGYTLTDRQLKRSDLDPKLMDNLIWILLISGLIGARLSYLARNISAFQGNLKAVISINPALMDPVGGMLIGLASGFIFLSRKNISYLKILDGLAFFFSPVLISLSLSRFASGSSYGLPTSVPWGIHIWGERRHPVQLYFLAAGIVILLIVLFIHSRRPQAPGALFLLFSSLFSGAYLFFSGFQVTSSFIDNGIRVNQIIYWILFAISLTLRIYLNNPKTQENQNES